MKRKNTGEGDGEAESSIVGKKGQWQELDKVSTWKYFWEIMKEMNR